jgi:hypothetical protein
VPDGAVAGPPLRLSIVIEWTNTRLNGVLRAEQVLAELGGQWQRLVAGVHPEDLPAESARFLARLHPRAELLIVSGEPIDAELASAIRARAAAGFDVSVEVKEGLEYYPLKNFGAALASGELLLFVDSDVLPDPGWLAHLLGSFARPDVAVVAGQTYVGPCSLMGRAFALGWSYELRDPSGGLVQRRKFSGNNVAFRTDGFRRAGGFPSVGGATRGAASLLRRELERMGIAVWQNRSAAVDHPPPSGFRHLAMRGVAHGRDKYLTTCAWRSLGAFWASERAAARRLARGVASVFRDGARVGLSRREIPAAVALLCAYYGCFALGGVLTHLSPAAMGRHFRV